MSRYMLFRTSWFSFTTFQIISPLIPRYTSKFTVEQVLILLIYCITDISTCFELRFISVPIESRSFPAVQKCVTRTDQANSRQSMHISKLNRTAILGYVNSAQLLLLGYHHFSTCNQAFENGRHARELWYWCQRSDGSPARYNSRYLAFPLFNQIKAPGYLPSGRTYRIILGADSETTGWIHDSLFDAVSHLT